MDITNTIANMDSTLRAMANLPRGLRNKALRPALRKGAQVVQAAAIRNVKQVADKGYSKGVLSRSVVIRTLRTRNSTLRVAVTISPNKVSKAGVRVGLYGSVLEHGKKNQRPQPWLRPAAAQNERKAYETMRFEAARNLEKAIKEATGT